MSNKYSHNLWMNESEKPKPTGFPQDNTTSRPLTVETIDNHIYFYSYVDADRCLAMTQAIRETDTRLRSQHLSRGLNDKYQVPIWLHIQSYGGDLFAGLGMADQLAAIRTPVYSIIEGITASAATFISMACNRRYITPNSYMLIHQFSSGFWGTYEQFKDQMRLQEMAMDKVIDFYVQRTKVDAEQIREWLTRDFWMNAEMCVEHGFVDAILDNPLP